MASEEVGIVSVEIEKVSVGRDIAGEEIDRASFAHRRLSDAQREGSEEIDQASVARRITSEEIGIVGVGSGILSEEIGIASVDRDATSEEIDRSSFALQRAGEYTPLAIPDRQAASLVLSCTCEQSTRARTIFRRSTRYPDSATSERVFATDVATAVKKVGA
jgi:hypothetical protein